MLAVLWFYVQDWGMVFGPSGLLILVGVWMDHMLGAKPHRGRRRRR